jgi:hypothetical protein
MNPFVPHSQQPQPGQQIRVHYRRTAESRARPVRIDNKLIQQGRQQRNPAIGRPGKTVFTMINRKLKLYLTTRLQLQQLIQKEQRPDLAGTAQKDQTSPRFTLVQKRQEQGAERRHSQTSGNQHQILPDIHGEREAPAKRAAHADSSSRPHIFQRSGHVSDMPDAEFNRAVRRWEAAVRDRNLTGPGKGKFQKLPRQKRRGDGVAPFRTERK